LNFFCNNAAADMIIDVVVIPNDVCRLRFAEIYFIEKKSRYINRN